MYTLLESLKVREELLNRKLKVFTPRIFSRIFKTSPDSTKHYLETQAKRGAFLRIKRGLYALSTDPPSEEEIANALYKPSYISFEYALAYYGFLPESPYMITSATPKKAKLFEFGSTSYSYRYLRKNVYTGYSLITKDNRFFYIAEPEKALVDYLYFVSISKVSLNDRLRGELSLDKSKIEHYVALFDNSQLPKLAAKYL